MKDQEDKKVNLIAMQYEYSIRTSIRSSELYEYLIEKDWTLHFLCVEKKMNINAKIHNLKKVPFFVKSFPYLGQAFFKIVKIYNYNGKCAILTWSLIESYLGLLCVHFCKDLKVISFIRGDSYEVYELSDKPIIVKKVGLQLLRYIEKQVLSKANRVSSYPKKTRKECYTEVELIGN